MTTVEAGDLIAQLRAALQASEAARIKAEQERDEAKAVDGALHDTLDTLGISPYDNQHTPDWPVLLSTYGRVSLLIARMLDAEARATKAESLAFQLIMESNDCPDRSVSSCTGPDATHCGCAVEYRERLSQLTTGEA